MAGITQAIKTGTKTAGKTMVKTVSDAGSAVATSTRRTATKGKNAHSKTKNWDASQNPKARKPKPKNKPYTNSRPKYDKRQVRTVWKASRAKQVADIRNGNLDRPMPRRNEMWVKDKHGDWVTVRRTNPDRKRSWDMGHKPGHEYRDLHRDYMDGKISKKEFLEQYRDPRNYRVEDAGRNRSHLDEL